MPAPAAVAADRWVPVDPFPRIQNTFLASAEETERTRVAYFRVPGAATLYARAWFGPRAAGPPGHVHGGAIAAVLDEAMGAVCWMNGHPAVAAQITIGFVGMVPIGSETTIESRIESVEGRKVRLQATMTSPSGETVAEGQGLFVILKEETWQALSAAAGE